MSANLSIKLSLVDEILEERKMANLFVYIATSSSLEPFQGLCTDICTSLCLLLHLKTSVTLP